MVLLPTPQMQRLLLILLLFPLLMFLFLLPPILLLFLLLFLLLKFLLRFPLPTVPELLLFLLPPLPLAPLPSLFLLLLLQYQEFQNYTTDVSVANSASRTAVSAAFASCVVAAYSDSHYFAPASTYASASFAAVAKLASAVA